MLTVISDRKENMSPNSSENPGGSSQRSEEDVLSDLEKIEENKTPTLDAEADGVARDLKEKGINKDGSRN